MDSLPFEAYTSFCYIKGKYNSQQYWRRQAEWMLFKTRELSDPKLLAAGCAVPYPAFSCGVFNR